MMNCGLEALAKLGEIKNISAFTLIHAARDNGLNLFIFKVNNLSDLIRVQRPAIFHQKDHFVYIKNGESMPDGEYTGFVLGPAVLGRVISMPEAKFVKGGKNFLTGENKDGVKEGGGALGSILSVVGALVVPVIGGAVGGALGLGASTTAALSGVGAASVGGAIGGATGNAITHDNPLIGGLEGAGIGLGVGGGVAGVTAGGGLNNGLPSAVANFGKGTFQAISHPISSVANGINAGAAGISGSGLSPTINAFNTASGGAANAAGASSAGINAGTNAINTFNATSPAMSLASGGIGNVTGTALNNVGDFSLSSFNPNPNFSTTALKSAVSPASQSLFSQAGNAASSNPLGTAATLAGAAGVFGSKQPAYNAPSPGQNYSALNTFIGNTPQGVANNTFGLASINQNTDYVNTSIPDLQKQFTGNNQRTLDTINTAYDNQRQQLIHQYAQAGQNFANSSEAQDKVNQLEQKRTNDLTLAQQELQDQALGQAIQVKQQALSQGMQAGQWNQTLAMQLASLTGDQQNLQYAIANNDYESFQQIMGKLMTMGIPQKVQLTQ